MKRETANTGGLYFPKSLVMCWVRSSGWAGGDTDSPATLIMVKTETNSDRVCITTKIDVQILMDHNQNRLQMFAETVGLFLLPELPIIFDDKTWKFIGFSVRSMERPCGTMVLVKCKFYKF